jgi:hypothetical protein
MVPSTATPLHYKTTVRTTPTAAHTLYTVISPTKHSRPVTGRQLVLPSQLDFKSLTATKK